MDILIGGLSVLILSFFLFWFSCTLSTTMRLVGEYMCVQVFIAGGGGVGGSGGGRLVFFAEYQLQISQWKLAVLRLERCVCV